MKLLTLLALINSAVLVVVGIQLDKVEKAQQAIYMQATQANEMVRYWLPPVSETRMAAQCSRCHR